MFILMENDMMMMMNVYVQYGMFDEIRLPLSISTRFLHQNFSFYYNHPLFHSQCIFCANRNKNHTFRKSQLTSILPQKQFYVGIHSLLKTYRTGQLLSVTYPIM